MPDYNPSPSGDGPVRRQVRAAPPRRYGPGGLPTEGIDPAPTVHPAAPWIALLLILAFLALQLYPATHFRHPKDPNRSWVEIKKTATGELDHSATLKEALDTWGIPFYTDENQVDLQQGAKLLPKTEEVVDSEYVNEVHIVLSTDEKDLRPLAVVINSTISNAVHPERIKFYLVIPSSENKLEYYKLKAFFPEAASLEIISEDIDFSKSTELSKYRKDSNARKELSTPYNFVLFYLPQLLKDRDIDKFIYLDTDVVVKGNIEELYLRNIQGYPVAAVQDCSQRFDSYFDFEQLNEIHKREDGSKSWLPQKLFNAKECVFNRGVLLIDVKQWIRQNVTDTIEWWMKESNNAEKTLFQHGTSQPPFLLSVYKNYMDLGIQWNVRGLGHNSFSDQEMDFYTATHNVKPEKTPFISTESEHAKILHFNGEFKPWKIGRVRSTDAAVVSLCGEKRTECYKLWWDYLSRDAEERFK